MSEVEPQALDDETFGLPDDVLAMARSMRLNLEVVAAVGLQAAMETAFEEGRQKKAAKKKTSKEPKAPKPPKEPKPVKPSWNSPQCASKSVWPRIPILPDVMPKVPSFSLPILQATCCPIGDGSKAADSMWYTVKDTGTGIGAEPEHGYAALVLPSPDFNPRAVLMGLGLQQAWVTYALRCAPQNDKQWRGSSIAICRQHLSIAQDCRYVICLGERAWYAVTGRKTLPRSSGRVWLRLETGRVVPVVLVDEDAHVNPFALREAKRRIAGVHGRKPPPLPTPVKHGEVVTEEDFKALLAAERTVAVDVETYSEIPSNEFRIVSMAFAVGDLCWTWKEEEVPKWALSIFEDTTILKVFHNAVFDCRAILRHWNLKCARIADTLALRKLANPDGDGTLDALAEIMGHYSHKYIADLHLAALAQAADVYDRKTDASKAKTLTRLAGQWFDEGELLAKEYARVEAWGGLPESERVLSRVFAYMDIDNLRDYNAMDAGVTLAAYRYLYAHILGNPDLGPFYVEHVAPSLEAVVNMALNGWPCSKRKMADTVLRIYDRLEPLELAFREKYQCGPFERVATLHLARQFGVVEPEATSLDAAAIDASDHEFAKELGEIRRVKKRLDAALALHDAIWPDGYIRPSFNLTGARTGRLSCSRPNLQNVPKPDADEESHWIRECFIAPDGWTLVAIDYSQVELVVMASLAGDDVALKAILSGSYHMDTARIVVPIMLGITPEEVNEKEHKRYGKTANFGWLYGAGDKTTAERFNTTPEVARQMRQQVLGKKFARTGRFIENVQREAAKSGVARTWFLGRPARVRPLYDFGSPVRGKQGLAKRQSFNTRIQGSANDVCLLALVRNTLLSMRLADEQGNPLMVPCLSIHDALGFLVRTDYLDDVLHLISAEMTRDVGFPVSVEAEVGTNWADMDKAKLDPELLEYHRTASRAAAEFMVPHVQVRVPAFPQDSASAPAPDPAPDLAPDLASAPAPDPAPDLAPDLASDPAPA